MTSNVKFEEAEMKHRYFSLIELLIVIAIIAILAGMLLPALNKARQNVQTASCSGNLRQLGIMQTNYVDSYNGYFQPLEWKTGGTVESSWPALFADIQGLPIKHRTWFAANTFGPSSVFRCPAQKTWGGKAYGISYGYNYSALGDSNLATVKKKISTLRRPSAQLTHLDCWGTYLTPADRGDGSAYGESGKQGFRHQRRANVLYADGHVATGDELLLWRCDVQKFPWNLNGKEQDYMSVSWKQPWIVQYGYSPY